GEERDAPLAPAKPPGAPIDVDALVAEAEAAIRRVASASAPERAKPEEIALSFTALSAFLHCPLEYAQRYVLGVPPAPVGEDDPGRRAMLLGTLVHESIRAWNEAGRSIDARTALERCARASQAPPERINEAFEVLADYLECPGEIGTAYEHEFSLR